MAFWHLLSGLAEVVSDPGFTTSTLVDYGVDNFGWQTAILSSERCCYTMFSPRRMRRV